MKPNRYRRRLLAVVAVAAIGGISAAVVPQFANATRPHPRSLGVATAASAAALPVVATANCEGDATCDVSLFAKTGTVTAGTATVPIWGFTTDNTTPGFLGGDPLNTIVMDAGQTLNLDVHNCLPDGAGDLYVEMPAIAGPPPSAGAAVDAGCSGAGTLQSFVVMKPGTYVYEAGATVEQERQLAMGLAALVVVRPADFDATTNRVAYDLNMGPFNDEALVVMNEIDPKFNADPFAGDVEDYSPQYFFINGKAHPNTDDIGANAGDTVLLRAANLGIRDRALGLLNARLNLRAIDSHKVDEEPATVDLESQLLTPGQVVDVTTTVDVSAPAGSQFPVLDLDRNLNNGSQSPLMGGMLTFIDVVAGPAPTTTAVAEVTDLTPTTNDGSTGNDITVSVTFSGGTSGAAWSVDSSTNMHTFVAADGSTSVTVPIADVLADGAVTGDHIIWITPTGGAKSGGAFTLALEGPSVFGLTVDPPFANLSANKVDGTNNIIVTGSAQPSLLDYNIDDVELCLDAPGCGTSVMTDVTAPVGPSHAYGLRTSVAPSAFAAPGDDVIYIRAHETPTATGTARWSDWATIHDTVDTAGPTVTNVTASPSPAGIGNYPGNLNFLESVRIDADLNDDLSPIADAELFLYQQDATGTGAQMRPLSGQWLDDVNTLPGPHTRHAYLEVPISELQSQPQGTIHIFIHAKDAAGNWGGFTDFPLVLDKTNPQILDAGTDLVPSHHYAAQDETGAWVLTDGSIRFNAQDPDVGDGVAQLPTTPGGNQVQIRYHVSSVQGTIGQAGAGIFYQTGQQALGGAVDNGDGTYTVTFDWHLVYPPPGPNVLPPEATTSVWVWVLDAAGNPSDPIIVDVGPPTNPVQVP